MLQKDAEWNSKAHFFPPEASAESSKYLLPEQPEHNDTLTMERPKAVLLCPGDKATTAFTEFWESMGYYREVKRLGKNTQALREVSFPACPGPQLSCLSISEWCSLSLWQCPLPVQWVLRVRAGGHPGTVPKAAASCRNPSASSCPSVGYTAPEWC